MAKVETTAPTGGSNCYHLYLANRSIIGHKDNAFVYILAQIIKEK